MLNNNHIQNNLSKIESSESNGLKTNNYKEYSVTFLFKLLYISVGNKFNLL